MPYFDFSLSCECTETEMKFDASVFTALALGIVLDALSALSTALRPLPSVMWLSIYAPSKLSRLCNFYLVLQTLSHVFFIITVQFCSFFIPALGRFVPISASKFFLSDLPLMSCVYSNKHFCFIKHWLKVHKT
jgi:hypothetical protein